MWDAITPRLVAAGYRTVAPFMRGYAPSGIPATDAFSVQTLGGDVIGLIEALGETQAIVIGHDWGASAAYAAATIAPERIERLITLSIAHPLAIVQNPMALQASPHFAELAMPDAETAFAADDFSGVDAIYARWSPTWELPADELESVKNAFAFPGCLNAALGYYRAFASATPDPSLFATLATPTLTIYGESDGAGDMSVFEDHASGFTGQIEIVALPNVGHFPQREASVEVSDASLRFLQP